MTKDFKLIFVGAIFLVLPFFVSAASLGETTNFFINSAYDFFERGKISATLQKVGQRTYFYIDEQWWGTLEQQEKQQVDQALRSLDYEFYYKIYPTLTSYFGYEQKPGIDKESRITILIHPMTEDARGYFNSGDEYPRTQSPKSNEKEMFYLNADYITNPLAKSFLAHEFVHLITFNQKEKIHGVEEDVWLNEARAEYAPTLIGYDANYEESNLQQRVQSFISNPSDSLTEWQNQSADYGVLNLFTQYLVEHYGIEILADSLKSKTKGIKSLNEALKNNGFEEDFSQIFTDWTIAVLANDCSLGEKYCYKNENLKNLRVVPLINFLPLKGNSALGVSQTTKNWTGNWFKFIGGKGTLKIEFIGNPENLFKAPYLIQDFLGQYSLDFFQLDEYQRGEILVPEFGTKISSVTIIPSIQSKISGFLTPEPAFPFFWEASTIVIEEKEDPDPGLLEKPILEMSRQELLAKISEIEELLNQLKTQFAKIEEAEDTEPISISCQRFEENLFYGLRNDDSTYCLQQFLKSQGSEIYPEGLVTGNFLSLTRAAVIRFQEKYADEILTPLELEKGTGFVGIKTRAKINELLSY